MIDLHHHPDIANWGIRPVLFEVGKIQVESYSFFVLLGLLVGLFVFYLYAREKNQVNEKSFYIVFSGVIGGILGSKIPIWIMNFQAIVKKFPDISVLLSGRTVVGGIIGGTISVLLVKRKLGIKKRIGNSIAPAVTAGITVGRIGCYLRGCCYGKPTHTNFGVDFGDSVLRHPTQLYEFTFLLFLFIYLHKLSKNNPRPGVLFEKFLLYYFSFRFMIEFIRVEPVVFMGLTIFQIASLIVVVYILFIKKYLNKIIDKKVKNVG